MKYLPLTIAIVLFYFTPITLIAQNNFEDSVLQVIKNSKHKTNAENYLILARYFSKNDKFDKSIFYGNKVLSISQQTKNKKLELKALNFLATSHYFNSDYVNAEKQYKKALDLAQKLNDEFLIADISMNLGGIMQLNSNYKESFDLFLKARTIFEKDKNWDQLIVCYHNIAAVLSNLEQSEKVIAYYVKIEQILPKVKSDLNKIKAYSLLASYYNDYGEGSDKSIALTISYCNKAIDLSRKINDYSRLAYLYSCLARAYEIKGEYKNSIFHYENALKYIGSSNIKVDRFAFVGLYYSYMELNDAKNAKKYLNEIKNHQYTKTIDMYKIEYLQMLYEYNKKHDLKAALENLEEISALKENIKTKENVSAVSELEKKYNQSKNYASILELRSQKKLLVEKNKIKNLQVQILIFSALFLVIIIVISIYLYRQNIKNKQLKIVEIEQNLARVRMNPHFIFNVLSSLQALSLDASKTKLMSEYISRFSKIMRQTLESSFSELISLEDEIDFLTNYLELQKLVKGEKFDFEMHLSEDLNSFEIMVPVMIFQPFIENAIEHGFSKIQSGGKIDIYFEEKNHLLYVKISDNGSWTTSVSNKAYPSRAMEIINSRFFLLQKRYKKRATFEINKELKGVDVDIRLPQFN